LKIYGTRTLGSPRRLAIYLEEKGLEIPFVDVNLFEGEHRAPEFLARNPIALVPVLELDDGTCISETMSIARYLEELHPSPPFLGRDPLERATLDMWQRRVEFGFYTQIRAYFRQTSPYAKVLEPVQVPEWGELNKGYAEDSLRVLDGQLASNEFIAGPHFSWADITVVTSLEGTAITGFQIPDDCKNVVRWYTTASTRPSVVATQPPP
jgi:glutathione S-transferase